MIQKSGAHQYGGGWAMRATKKRHVWQVNLHKVKVTYLGVRQSMRLCSKCIRRVKGAISEKQAEGQKPGKKAENLQPAPAVPSVGITL